MSFTETLAALAAEELLRARLVRVIPVIAPAAGADWSIAVPGGVVWQPQTVQATLTTSAVVANRGPRLLFSDGNVSYANVPIPTALTASAAWRILYAKFAALNSGSPGGSGIMQSLPDFSMTAGSVLSVTTTNIDAGDQWSAITVTVLEWGENEIFDICMEIGLHVDQLLDRSNRLPLSWRD